MRYNFAEKKLSHHFSTERMTLIKKYILAGISLNIVGMPGIGISITLRYVAMQDYAKMYYLDMYTLSTISSDELFKQIFTILGGKSIPKTRQELLQRCNDMLIESVEGEKKVVIIINRFHRLSKEFSKEFFSHLRFLQNSSKGNIVFLISTYRPLSDTYANEIMGSNTTIFSTFFLKPFSKEEREELLLLNPTQLKSRREIQSILEVSGGHPNIIQLLMRSSYIHNPLLDSFINLQLKIIEEILTKKEKMLLRKILQGKIKIEESFLTQIGLIDKSGKIFSPLFEEYLEKQTPIKLPKKEALIFTFLKKKREKVVTKEELFSLLWKGDNDHATDWALNALIYRLRNNEYFKKSGYIIESFKGVGYRITKD